MPRRFNAVNPKWAFGNFMSKKTLMDPRHGYVVGDNCVFGAEVYVITPQRISECLTLFKPTAPCKRRIKVSNLSDLAVVWKSREFSLGGHKWMVRVYPKGTAKATRGHISIYVSSIDSKSFAPHQKLKADVSLRIKSKLRDIRHHTRDCKLLVLRIRFSIYS